MYRIKPMFDRVLVRRKVEVGGFTDIDADGFAVRNKLGLGPCFCHMQRGTMAT